MQFFIGREVKIKTTLGDEFEGEIFAIDLEKTASIMLRQNNFIFHWIKNSIVRDIKAIDRPGHRAGSFDQYLPPIDWNAVALREQAVATRP